MLVSRCGPSILKRETSSLSFHDEKWFRDETWFKGSSRPRMKLHATTSCTYVYGVLMAHTYEDACMTVKWGESGHDA